MIRIILTLILGLIITLPISANTSQAEWTFLVFLNADNNLDSFGVKDLKEMQKVGSRSHLNIVVQMDRSGGKPAKRYLVQKGASEILEDLGEVDMGSIDELKNFALWGMKKYPAKHYALILWNHGSGWVRYPNAIFKGISYDDQSGNHITTNELETGLREIKEEMGRNIDIIGFDACLMQMAEVAYAIKGSADFMVASEELEPGNGWPYDSVLKVLKNKGTGPEQLARHIVKAYDKSYASWLLPSKTTQSYLRLAELDNLVEAIGALRESGFSQKIADINSSLSKVQKFYYRSNIDLLHLCELWLENSQNSLEREALMRLQSSLNALIGHSETNSSKMKNAKGLAIYFPAKGYSFSKNYQSLSFAKDSEWDEFLSDFYKKSKTNLNDL